MTHNFNGMRVLVLDDNRYMCRIVQTILTSFGIEKATVATEGNEALKLLREQKFDLAIIDHLMQPMDGLTFTRLVRTAANSPNPDMPILMMTAYTEKHRIEAAKIAGVNTLLVKPFTPAELYRRIVYATTMPYDKEACTSSAADPHEDSDSIVYL